MPNPIAERTYIRFARVRGKIYLVFLYDFREKGQWRSRKELSVSYDMKEFGERGCVGVVRQRVTCWRGEGSAGCMMGDVHSGLGV